MTKTILDKSSIDGLLRMAGDEGLLEDRENYGDKLLYSLRQRPLAEWHRQQILEQVILNDKIISAKKIPFDWLKGEFVDLNLVLESSIEEENDNLLDRVSPELIEGMLLARGYDSDLGKWQIILDKAQSVLNEIERFEENNPGLKVDSFSDLIKGAINNNFRETYHFKLASKWNLATQEARPIMNVIEELISLSNHAEQTGNHLRVPTYHPSGNLVNIPKPEYVGGEATKIFRITTQKLGSFPVVENLSSALALAQRPETIALRSKISEWTSSIDNSSVDVTVKIQRDIEKATSSLNTAGQLKSAGLLAGIVSIPVSAVGIVNPFFGALGLGLTCIGVILDRSGAAMERSVNWIGFGTIRS